jgi:hypothetical protein
MQKKKSLTRLVEELFYNASSFVELEIILNQCNFKAIAKNNKHY